MIQPDHARLAERATESLTVTTVLERWLEVEPALAAARRPAAEDRAAAGTPEDASPPDHVAPRRVVGIRR